MRVQIWKTGEPWFDIGIIGLYDNLKKIREQIEDEELDEEVLPTLRLTRHMLEFELNPQEIECLQEECERYVAEKLKQILLLPREWKLLGRTNWKMDGQFWDVTKKEKLSDAEYKWLKEEKKLKGINKEIALIKIKNYFGTTTNWKGLTENYTKEIDAFMQQHLAPRPKNAKRCPLCNRSAKTKTFKGMNQNRNPFFNQHHATKVRGYDSGVGVQEMCPTCNLLSLYSLIQTQWIPYYVSGNTDLLIPEMNDLLSLAHLVNKLGQNLLDLQHPKVIDYTSNIRSLPNCSLYISLLAIYHWFNEQRDELAPLDQTSQHSLKSWIIARYGVDQSVNFREFYRINVTDELFRLTDEIPFGDQMQQKGTLLHQFFHEVRTDEPRFLERIAKGIVKRDLTLINDGWFLWFKQLKRKPQKQWMSWTAYTFFSDFLSFILVEVMGIVNAELQQDIRALGQAIGKHCAGDLSLLTKLNTATSVQSFKQALNEAFFKMVKMVHQAQHHTEQRDQLFHIRAESLHHILEALTEENVVDIRNTIMLFANLQAFWTVKKSQQNKKETSRDD